MRCHALVALKGLALTVWLFLPLEAFGAQETRLDVLQTRTAVYTNVTVTTAAKNYIFILHAGGMASVKVADLPVEVQQQLGYGIAKDSKSSTNTVTGWANREMAKLQVNKVFGGRFDRTWHNRAPAGLGSLGFISSKLLPFLLGMSLLFYLFYSYCCLLICRKAGKPPGVLIWVPLLQCIPMLRAAGMSSWWFVAFFVPLLNLVPSVLWPLKIVKARSKSIWVGVLLLLPVANLIAFLYLAFSDAAPANEDEEPEPKVMTLEAA